MEQGPQTDFTVFRIFVRGDIWAKHHKSRCNNGLDMLVPWPHNRKKPFFWISPCSSKRVMKLPKIPRTCCSRIPCDTPLAITWFSILFPERPSCFLPFPSHHQMPCATAPPVQNSLGGHLPHPAIARQFQHLGRRVESLNWLNRLNLLHTWNIMTSFRKPSQEISECFIVLPSHTPLRFGTTQLSCRLFRLLPHLISNVF